MKTAISHRYSKRIIAVVMMLLLAAAAVLGTGSPAKADDDGPANYSFYKLSSSLAAFFSNAQSPDDSAPVIDPEVWKSVLKEPGSAGSMLGYVDPDFSFSMEFLNSQVSGSSSSVGYNTLIQTAPEGGSRSTATPGMLDYAHFGAALNGLGLDSMSTGLSTNFLAPVGGSLMLLLYCLTGGIDLMFSACIGLLKLLNPFRLFYSGVVAINPTFAEGMTGGQAADGLFGGLSSWIGDWYQVLNNISWTILVPLFIGFVVLALVLGKKEQRGSKLKKLAIRMVFIGVGLPLIGSMYTGTLNAMGDASGSGSSGSTQVVLSTYVDFQNWAYENRLMVPENAVIGWNASENRPTTEALANVRHTALEINKSTNPSWATITSSFNLAQDQSWTQAAMNGAASDSVSGVGGYMATVDLLGRYISGDKLDAASYETAVKGSISTSWPYTRDPEGKAQVSGWFNGFGDPEKTLPAIEDPNVVAGNPVLRVETGTGLQAEPEGATSGNKVFTSPAQRTCDIWVSGGDGQPLGCNMSSLSMYNYLNTSFGADSMLMYSSNKATSGATREVHNSVTQVGTGLMSGMYWLNSMILLASFVVIGFGYALWMVFSNILRTFQLMTAIPFATIGAMAGIAKVLIYTTAMIMEIILTLFLYRFIQVFLIAIPQIIEMPFSRVLNDSSAASSAATANLLLGGTLPLVMTVLSIIALIVFTVLAMRVRGSVVKAIREVVTKLVDKFMETNVAPPGGSGDLARGLSAGAGMAAANKMLGGNKPAAGAAAAGGSKGGPKGMVAGGIPAGQGPNGPEGGSPAGELTVGGGAGMEVTGSSGAAGPDGSGGRPGGSGDKGGPLAPLSGGGGVLAPDEQDQAEARAVQARGGLSEPGSNGSGDVMDTAAGSMERTQEQYRAKDQATADGAVAAGKAVAKGAEAAGRGAAGDAAGAASAGTQALGQAQSAQDSAQKARDIGKEINSPTADSAAGPADDGRVGAPSSGSAATAAAGDVAPNGPAMSAASAQAPHAMPAGPSASAEGPRESTGGAGAPSTASASASAPASASASAEAPAPAPAAATPSMSRATSGESSPAPAAPTTGQEGAGSAATPASGQGPAPVAGGAVGAASTSGQGAATQQPKAGGQSGVRPRKEVAPAPRPASRQATATAPGAQTGSGARKQASPAAASSSGAQGPRGSAAKGAGTGKSASSPRPGTPKVATAPRAVAGSARTGAPKAATAPRTAPAPRTGTPAPHTGASKAATAQRATPARTGAPKAATAPRTPPAPRTGAPKAATAPRTAPAPRTAAPKVSAPAPARPAAPRTAATRVPGTAAAPVTPAPRAPRVSQTRMPDIPAWTSTPKPLRQDGDA